MNKYTLTFKNNSIEEQYQKNCIGMIRMNMFKLIIVSQIIVYAVRVGQAAIQKNYIYTVLSLAMIIYLVIQYYITKKYQKLLRSSIIMVNHVFTIYLLLIEDSNDPYSSYLRGVNQMGSNLFMMLAGEFIDALFSLISIQIIRIIIVFIKSSSIEYYAIFAVFVILTYASKQLHMYHKALRSQFFLTLKEKQWQNIFDQIIQDIPYLLLTFDEEELKFMVSTIKNCGEFLPNNKIALQFLRFSNNQGQSLEQIIYKEISNYKQQKQEVFNRKLCVYQDRRQFLIEYSIFYGNQPSVLIKFKDLKQISNNYQRDDQINHSKSSLEYYCFSLKFIQKLLIVEDKTYFLRQVRKKFVILKMIDEIQTSTFVPKRINFNQILGQIKKFYPLIKINFIIDSDIQIYSIPSLINLFLISTLETLESNHIGIYQRSQFNEYLEFHFTGTFSFQLLTQIHQKYMNKFNLIIANLKIQKHCKILFKLVISFKLFQTAFVPFYL